jgi:hypothetical protein
MSDHALTDDDGASLTSGQPVGRSWWLYRLLPLLAFLAASVAGAIKYWDVIVSQGNGYIPIVTGVVLAIFLSLLPAMICVVQNSTRERQLNRLKALRSFPVSRTTYFKTALISVNRMLTGAVDFDFELPLFVYFLVVFIGFVAFLNGYQFQPTFKVPSVILGGLHARDDSLADYQSGTFCVIAVAFFAAYIYSLGRLLDRVNNNDLYPISLYYYTVRVVVACVAAAILRHAADAIHVDTNATLLLIAFGIGFAPDLFIIAMSRRAFQAMKIWGTRDDPDPSSRPTALPLLMIDDLSRDKIDRLSELGIDSAQVLARQNPFLLLPRLPYDLGLIVDWIGQAQLYILVKDDKLAALRKIYVRDVFDLHARLRCDAACPPICGALGIAVPEAPSLARQLEQDPAFARLREVRVALVPRLLT